MPTTTCAHCDVQIVDDSSMVTRAGQSFCCENCAANELSHTTLPAFGTCFHCYVPIVDPSPRAVRDGRTFCCNNCAAAMPAGVASVH